MIECEGLLELASALALVLLGPALSVLSAHDEETAECLKSLAKAA